MILGDKTAIKGLCLELTLILLKTPAFRGTYQDTAVTADFIPCAGKTGENLEGQSDQPYR
jgi:hypothetical protein